MRGRGLNSRPPGSDTLMEDLPLLIQPYNPGDIEGAGRRLLTVKHANFVMNDTCIDMRPMRVLGLNIYMFMRRKIYKEPL
jgi:hypothetical protein